MKEIRSDQAKLAKLQQQLTVQLPTPEQALPVNWGEQDNIQIFMKRDDAMHNIISGNKWRKLQYTLLTARQNNIRHIMSFGGGHSNHLHALAYCCQQLNISLSAFVRGDYSQHLTPTLRDLAQWGTRIHYVTKADYKKRYSEQYIAALQQSHSMPGNTLVIPEGGSSHHALAGVASLLDELQHSYDFICCPVGSGSTLAGLAWGLANATSESCETGENDETDEIEERKPTLLGLAMLKGKGHLEELVQNLLPPTIPIPTIIHQFHGGGFAKKPDWLVDFCAAFIEETGVEIEPVYSGKLCFGVKSLIEAGYFPPNSRILILHTGGLQGNRHGNL